LAKFRVEKFGFKHVDEINSWYEQRGLPTLGIREFPERGFVISGVAAVFVYLTDSSIALCEGLITNPGVSPVVSGKSAKFLIEYSYKEARKLRPNVLVIVKERSVQKFVKSIGYRSIGSYELLIRR
jgi:hypothetical protein